MGRPTTIPNGKAAQAAADKLIELELEFLPIPEDTPDGPPSDEEVYAMMGGSPDGPGVDTALPLDLPSLPDNVPGDAPADPDIGGMAPDFVFDLI